jgi:hypothetical protein
MVAQIKAYRAPDDVETSLRYAEGHRKVLEAYGVKQVTSTNHNWLHDPNTYVIIVESEDGDQIYGGTRVQVRSPEPQNADGKTPLQRSIRVYMDTSTTSVIITLRNSAGFSIPRK